MLRRRFFGDSNANNDRVRWGENLGETTENGTGNAELKSKRRRRERVRVEVGCVVGISAATSDCALLGSGLAHRQMEVTENEW